MFQFCSQKPPPHTKISTNIRAKKTQFSKVAEKMNLKKGGFQRGLFLKIFVVIFRSRAVRDAKVFLDLPWGGGKLQVLARRKSIFAGGRAHKIHSRRSSRTTLCVSRTLSMSRVCPVGVRGWSGAESSASVPRFAARKNLSASDALPAAGTHLYDVPLFFLPARVSVGPSPHWLSRTASRSRPTGRPAAVKRFPRGGRVVAPHRIASVTSLFLFKQVEI